MDSDDESSFSYDSEVHYSPPKEKIPKDSFRFERINRVDPFLRDRPQQSFNIKLWLTVPVVIILSWILLLVCFGIDYSTRNWSHELVPIRKIDHSFQHFFYTLMNPTPETSLNVMESMTTALAYVFGMIIAVIGLILQFAADNLTTHVIILFFQDSGVLSVIAFMIIGNCFGLWVYSSVSYIQSPRAAVVLSVFIVNIQLGILFPFLSYLFNFLDGQVVVNTIITKGLKGVLNAIEGDENEIRNAKIEQSQQETVKAIEVLMDTSMECMRDRNRVIPSDIIDAFCSFCMHYLEMKDKTPKKWFAIPTWMRQNPDFFSLNDKSIREIEEKRLWVEWMVLRQYQATFCDYIKSFNEMCYHINISTRIIAETSAELNELYTTDLCIKYFNTFVRIGIASANIRTVYATLYQYRLLAENLTLIACESNPPSTFLRRTIRISKYLRYYAHVCASNRLFFLVETISHDLRYLCHTVLNISLSKNDPIFDKVNKILLDVFLSFADFASKAPETKKCVFKAMSYLGVLYFHSGKTRYMTKTIEVLDREENSSLLIAIANELCGYVTPEFFEVTERGMNFGFVETPLRSKVPFFFAQFQWWNPNLQLTVLSNESEMDDVFCWEEDENEEEEKKGKDNFVESDEEENEETVEEIRR